ncbi:retropepsin-like aspartic protease family protein [Cylindrospermum sp. FACHB-282]|uniref:retropepsin-like aspartic protease family protein n=1 Tax=Cylindrospermum sp. FACHB-282 TaxID=2692794 RepID=UPI001689A501|nr:retropepsin-like aspartic protease [Cylindrospermum sp. FACHB-282]MBD2386052.1 retroviral-like aspartic protease family protein [Cylindrospermum sp. FACHB-282]
MKDALRRWMMTSNLVLMAVVPTLTFLSLSHQVRAKDPGVCFMVTSSGKMVNLNTLCGVTIPKDEIAQIPQSATIPKDEIARIPQSATIPNGEIARIPIKRRIGNTPVIEVTFNNKQSFEMILDTGANGTLITRKMANTLKVKATGTMEVEIADGSEVKFLTGQVKSMAVGGVVAKNLQVAIAPKAGIGLLGHDFFGNYDIKLLAKEVQFQRR